MSILTLLVIGPILSIVRNLHISQMLCEWKNIMLLEFNTNVVHSLDGTCNIQLWFQYAWWLKNIYCYTLHVIHDIIHLSLNNILTITWCYIWNLKGSTCSNLSTCPRNFHVTRPYWFLITKPIFHTLNKFKKINVILVYINFLTFHITTYFTWILTFPTL